MSDENKIKVIYVQPGKRAEVIEIEACLEKMQGLVGGHIEEYMPFEDEVAIICNEEGKMNGAPLNRAIYNADGKIIEIMAGDFFLCYAPIESENFKSLTPDLLKKYGKKFKTPEAFRRTTDGIKAIKQEVQRDDFGR